MDLQKMIKELDDTSKRNSVLKHQKKLAFFLSRIDRIMEAKYKEAKYLTREVFIKNLTAKEGKEYQSPRL